MFIKVKIVTIRHRNKRNTPAKNVLLPKLNSTHFVLLFSCRTWHNGKNSLVSGSCLLQTVSSSCLLQTNVSFVATIENWGQRWPKITVQTVSVPARLNRMFLNQNIQIWTHHNKIKMKNVTEYWVSQDWIYSSTRCSPTNSLRNISALRIQRQKEAQTWGEGPVYLQTSQNQTAGKVKGAWRAQFRGEIWRQGLGQITWQVGVGGRKHHGASCMSPGSAADSVWETTSCIEFISTKDPRQRTRVLSGGKKEIPRFRQ